MEALVTGGTGFVGRSLVAELLARGWDVRVLARHAARARSLPRAVDVVYGDLGDERALSAATQNVDVVFHLAAATSGPWEIHAETTVEGTRRLLQACRAAGVARFVLVSSIVVYDKSGLRAGAVVDESAPLLAPVAGAGAYARGKLEAERLARDYVQGSDGGRIELVIARPGLVYAVGASGANGSIAAGTDVDGGAFASIALAEDAVSARFGASAMRLSLPHLGALVGAARIAYGSPSLLLPLLELRSCARALAELARSPQAAGKIYHIVDAHRTSRRNYLDALASLTGYRQRVIHLPAAPVAAACAALGALGRLTGKPGVSDLSASKIRARASELVYDTAALERDTGWRPRRGLAGGLARGRRARAPRAIERVGIVGAGAMSRAHLAALRRISGVRLVGILDVSRSAAEALAAEARRPRSGAPTPVPAFAEPERFYAEARPDLVHVITPPQSHAAAALDALRHGAHVLLEKPAVSSLAECDALLLAAAAADRTIGVDETVAWDPLIRRARAALVHGVLGELVHVDVFMAYDLRRGGRLARVLGDERCWERRLAGGPLEDLLPHPLSVVRALCGVLEPTSSRSTVTGRLPCDFPDELRLSLAAERVTAHVALSLSTRPDDFVVGVYGTRASVRIDVQNMLYDCATPLPGPRAVARGLRVVRSAARALGQTAANGLAIAIGRAPPPASSLHLIAAHYAALARGEPPPAPLRLARPDVAIARKIWPAASSIAADALAPRRPRPPGRDRAAAAARECAG